MASIASCSMHRVESSDISGCNFEQATCSGTTTTATNAKLYEYVNEVKDPTQVVIKPSPPLHPPPTSPPILTPILFSHLLQPTNSLCLTLHNHHISHPKPPIPIAIVSLPSPPQTRLLIPIQSISPSFKHTSPSSSSPIINNTSHSIPPPTIEYTPITFITRPAMSYPYHLYFYPYVPPCPPPPPPSPMSWSYYSSYYSTRRPSSSSGSSSGYYHGYTYSSGRDVEATKEKELEAWLAEKKRKKEVEKVQKQLDKLKKEEKTRYDWW